MENLREIITELRKLLCEYHISKQGMQVSTHVSALEIALCLVEMGIEDKRAIRNDEENWFKAGYHLTYVFPSGNEWGRISLLYDKMVDATEELNYFR